MRIKRVVIELNSLVEKQIDTSIKPIQTDWGGELRAFINYLKSQGMTHRVMCPYAHQQNRIVERNHNHIIEVDLFLLVQASLLLKFWEDSFVIAAYLINRLFPWETFDVLSPLTKISESNLTIHS